MDQDPIGSDDLSCRAIELAGPMDRKLPKLAAVALASKMARIIWAMMARGEAYWRQPVTTA